MLITIHIYTHTLRYTHTHTHTHIYSEFVYIYIYIYISCKVRLENVVEGNENSPFSIVTTRGVGEGITLFLRLLHFTLNTYLILLSVKQAGIKYHFSSVCYDAPWD